MQNQKKIHPVPRRRNASDLNESFKIRYFSFLEEGVIASNPERLYYDVRDTLPESTTFVAEKDGRIVGTERLSVDTLYGLGMDGRGLDFKQALEPFRKKGERIAEVDKLAWIPEAESKLSDHLGFQKYVFWAAKNLGVERIVATTKPRLLRFYEKMLCYDRVTPYPLLSEIEGKIYR